MPARISISFAASAVADLDEIMVYYRDQDVPEVGQRLVADIISQVETLVRHPDMGRVVPEFGVEHLRELIRPPFRIVYWRDKAKIRIIRVWRSERLLTLPDNP